VDLCVEVAMNLLDIYSANLGQSAQVDKLVDRLHFRVRDEVEMAQNAYQLKGALDMLKA
jgi:U3 small nucleolar RNA-associated protein 15